MLDSLLEQKMETSNPCTEYLAILFYMHADLDILTNVQVLISISFIILCQRLNNPLLSYEYLKT